MSWNYRICTRLNGIREFKICEVYYDKKGTAEAYIESKQILCWDNKKDLLKTIELLQSVPDKEIYDLDNWPNLYKPTKNAKDKTKDKTVPTSGKDV
jgi:hypothetical protein